MSSELDFDFLIGDWDVAHRRLQHRLAGADDWQAFSGTASCRKILGGQGNCDENHLDLPAGAYHALTIRTFDPGTREWSIWWLDGRFPGALDTPMRGRFEGGLGTFLARDQFEGRPIVVRFLWRVQPGEPPRWEQAFSADDGQTWETNWTMVFHRRG
jgi:hypothetical protein